MAGPIPSRGELHRMTPYDSIVEWRERKRHSVCLSVGKNLLRIARRANIPPTGESTSVDRVTCA